MRWLIGCWLLLMCPASVVPGLARPEIVSFSAELQPCMNEGCATFTWVTRGIGDIRLESGAIDEQGFFHPGGWHMETDLPASGSAGFRPKIDNYAARLCIDSPLAEPVCAVCNPFEPALCLAEPANMREP
ncbi:MAG: hypothetical protein CL610_21020 [Anaerolineaceae bacterium]|nr:hypothetical protein [Anaerolineaceae bacterium]